MPVAEDSVTADDTGKPIVDSEGYHIGIIADISGDTVSVEPNPNITDDIRATLGWGEADDEYQITAEALKRSPRADVAVFEVLPGELNQD